MALANNRGGHFYNLPGILIILKLFRSYHKPAEPSRSGNSK
jgi:hypothetical protein